MVWVIVGSRDNIGVLASEDRMVQILGYNGLNDLRGRRGGFVKPYRDVSSLETKKSL